MLENLKKNEKIFGDICSPLVSVVLPVYNCEEYLIETVNSVLYQTYKNIEIIIIDDGSIDSTQKIAENLSLENEQIIYRRQENSGVSVTRNNGLNLCQGEFICFIDGDDLWPTTKIEAQVEFLKTNNQYNFVCGNYVEVPQNFNLPDNGGELVTQSIDFNKSGWVYSRILKGNHIHIITLMFRKEMKREVSFDSSLKIAEDYDLWLRLSANYKIAFLVSCLAFYRRHPISILTKPQDKCYKAIVLQRNVERFGFKCKSGREVSPQEFNSYLYDAWFSHASLLYHSGKSYRLCMKAQLMALKYKPYAIQPWKYIAASVVMSILSVFGK